MAKNGNKKATANKKTAKKKFSGSAELIKAKKTRKQLLDEAAGISKVKTRKKTTKKA